MKTNDAGEGQAILHNLALAPLNEMKSLKVSPLTPGKLFRLCEASYDFAFFSPEVVGDIPLNNPSDLVLVFDCVVEGYSRLTFSSDVDALCHQVRTITAISVGSAESWDFFSTYQCKAFFE